MRPRKTALGVLTTAPQGPRRLDFAAPHQHSHVVPLLAIAALLLAMVLGLRLATGSGSATLPTHLTGYELDQLEEVRYLLWLDQSRNGLGEAR